MIEAIGLRKVYGDIEAVREVSFTIPAGQICGYLGANGAGKSTTVKMLTGLVTPTSGVARVGGYDLAVAPLEAKKRLGYVPETGALYESLSPVEYLRFVGRLYQVPEKLLDNKIEEFLDLWSLSDQRHDRMSGFSKGMKQKVVLTAGLLHDPQAIFLDEPLNGVDANAALLLKELMYKLARAGKAILYTSHILDVVERVCDRVIILHKGQILADGTMDQLKTQAGQGSLEQVFNVMTNTSDIPTVAEAMLDVIQRTESKGPQVTKETPKLQNVDTPK